MTAAQITSKLADQKIIHETAIAIAKLLEEAAAKIEGDEDDAREAILALITEDE